MVGIIGRDLLRENFNELQDYDSDHAWSLLLRSLHKNRKVIAFSCTDKGTYDDQLIVIYSWVSSWLSGPDVSK